MRKEYANANMLLRKFSYCSLDVKCCMFKSYCSTMYTSYMWFDSTVTSMRKLKTCLELRSQEVTKPAKI